MKYQCVCGHQWDRGTEQCPKCNPQYHENGTIKFSLDGTMLDEDGNRSIFDDIDE